MKKYILLLFSIHFTFASIGKYHRDNGFLSHVQLVHEFRCSMPQPRAVPVAELLTVGPNSDEVFYPASTVLKRCDGAGCCSDYKQICAPVETRNVSLVFMVKHMIDRQRDRHHEVIHALEHTKCGCINKKIIKFD
ncbi:vascular endothelial growth factor A-A-like [Apis dorsata]|uniref:vascular endothelial growth factor A-A-like n=1 Tax=Apis dorsata TaxID=7462 RepID=UPI0003DF719E|nr:vascular endothelial growth factor A-A-like [Apis dorsata]